MARNEFYRGVPALLAHQAGNCCSLPGCTFPTAGPSKESTIAVSNTGMACHIIPASSGPGARRVDLAIGADEIKSINNGIWLCYTHGKLIDTDEVRFSTPMLKKWREIAELRASIRQLTGKEPNAGWGSLSKLPLTREEITIKALGNENDSIGNALTDCACGPIWGYEFTALARDLLIELTRNSFTHGQAKNVSILIEANRIVFRDDGQCFDQLSLAKLNKGRGGRHALKYFINNQNNKAIVAYRWLDEKNEILIGRANATTEIQAITSCHIVFDRASRSAIKNDNDLAPCSIVYYLLPNHLAPSDAFKMEILVEDNIDTTKEIVFAAGCMSNSVLDILKDRFPQYRIIRFEDIP